MTPRAIDRLESWLKWIGLLLTLAALGIIGGYLLASLTQESSVVWQSPPRQHVPLNPSKERP